MAQHPENDPSRVEQQQILNESQISEVSFSAQKTLNQGPKLTFCLPCQWRVN